MLLFIYFEYIRFLYKAVFFMGVTPEYTKKAINKYNSKFDRIAVNLPIGTKERIKELTGKSCNAYISDSVLAELERIERSKSSELPF